MGYWSSSRQSAISNPMPTDRNNKRVTLVQIALPVSLRGHSACSHTQKPENPINDIEQQASYGNGSDVGWRLLNVPRS